MLLAGLDIETCPDTQPHSLCEKLHLGAIIKIWKIPKLDAESQACIVRLLDVYFSQISPGQIAETLVGDIALLVHR